MKIVFMGTPEFAVPSLELLHFADPIDVIAVITQPDRPAGRGNKIQQPPIKIFANDKLIETFQPEKIREDNNVIDFLKHSNADAFVTVAFGQILSKEILDIPRLGTINLHASLLPKYRGANPIQWAIINGDSTTGVTTMLTEEGVDCGPVLLRQELPITIDDNAIHLTKIMSRIGSRVLLDTLIGLNEGVIKPIPQDHSMATKAPKLKKSRGNIKWDHSAWQIHNIIRGTKPWPGAYSYFNNKLIKIHSSYLPSLSEEKKDFKPGEIKDITKSTLQVYTGNGYLDITEVQPLNKSVMKAVDWARGTRIQPGEKFSQEPQLINN
ncbi:MAG: methionyl-tRNA formyltransferase [Cyanobacteriota bacterium]